MTKSNQKYESGAGQFLVLLAGAMFVFMLLPTINMVNLNTSRILERPRSGSPGPATRSR